MSKFRDYIEEKLGAAEQSRMDFEVSEISQMLSEIIKKLVNTRQIGKAYFGKDLKAVEKNIRKSLQDVNNVITKLRKEK